MNEIRVEDVDSPDDKRQPQVSVLKQKAQGIGANAAKLQENPKKEQSKVEAEEVSQGPVVMQNIEEKEKSDEIEQGNEPEELYMPSSPLKEEELPLKIEPNVVRPKSPEPRTDTTQHIPVPPQVEIVETARLDRRSKGKNKHSAEASRGAIDTKQFKKVKARKNYVNHRESYQSLLKKAEEYKKTMPLLIRSMKSIEPGRAQKNETSRLNIFKMCPGLIDFGLYDPPEDHDNHESLIHSLPDNFSLNRTTTLRSLRPCEQVSALQEVISRRSIERKSESRLRQMNEYFEKCKSFKPMISYEPDFKRPNSQMRSSMPIVKPAMLPSKPPTEKERCPAVDFSEKHRFKIKSNKFINSVYGKPVVGWGITVGRSDLSLLNSKISKQK